MKTAIYTHYAPTALNAWQTQVINQKETLLLKHPPQPNMITALAMDREFHLNQLGQTLEHSRLGQEELRRLSHQILAAQETDAGDTPKE